MIFTKLKASPGQVKNQWHRLTDMQRVAVNEAVTCKRDLTVTVASVGGTNMLWDLEVDHDR